jgi:hypothetical protein
MANTDVAGCADDKTSKSSSTEVPALFPAAAALGDEAAHRELDQVVAHSGNSINIARSMNSDNLGIRHGQAPAKGDISTWPRETTFLLSLDSVRLLT